VRTARTIEAAATGTRARVGWRLAAGSALLASGVLGLALAPAGVAGAQQNGWGGSGGSGGSGSQWGGSGGNGGQGCEGVASGPWWKCATGVGSVVTCRSAKEVLPRGTASIAY
jgi:hypothetical protein